MSTAIASATSRVLNSSIANLIIEKCAAPDYKPLLLDYLNRAERLSYGRHTSHLLSEALGWHNRYLRSGQMRPQRED